MLLNIVCLETSSAVELDRRVLHIAPDMEIMNVKALLEDATGAPAGTMVLTFQETTLADDERTLCDYGVTEGSLITMRTRQSTAPQLQSQAAVATAPPALPNFDWSGVNFGPPGQARVGPRTQGAASNAAASTATAGGLQDEEDPLVLRERLLADTVQAQLLSENNPRLYDALVSGDPEAFVTELKAHQRAVAEQNMERIRLLAADPFDESAQQAIAERIRMENVEANMRTAMEYNPESFGTVVMLYVNCKLNGVPVKAFVDSGAQMTIVSQACAERCNIMRLVDRRFSGVAKGVGTQKIIGRVHLGQIQIEEDYLQASFSVLEDQSMDLLIGLDMLKRHQCCIDLNRNVLRIGTTGSETAFLAEKDLPRSARLTSVASQSGATSPGLSQNPSAQEQADQELAATLTESARLQQQQQQQQQQEQEQQQESIVRLEAMGFPREVSIAALRDSDGNFDLALMALFAQSLSGVGR